MSEREASTFTKSIISDFLYSFAVDDFEVLEPTAKDPVTNLLDTARQDEYPITSKPHKGIVILNPRKCLTLDLILGGFKCLWDLNPIEPCEVVTCDIL